MSIVNTKDLTYRQLFDFENFKKNKQEYDFEVKDIIVDENGDILMATTERALGNDEEDLTFTIITAREFVEKAEERVSRVMDILSGNDSKKAE